MMLRGTCRIEISLHVTASEGTTGPSWETPTYSPKNLESVALELEDAHALGEVEIADGGIDQVPGDARDLEVPLEVAASAEDLARFAVGDHQPVGKVLFSRHHILTHTTRPLKSESPPPWSQCIWDTTI